MRWHNTQTQYSSLSIFMHWLMVLLLIAAYCSMEFRDLFPRGSAERDLLKQWHFMLGLSIFFLVWVRLIARLMGQRPQVRPAPPKVQQRIATMMYLFLYTFMLVMPLLGWLLLSAAGKPIPFFGLELPALISENRSITKPISFWHETIAQVGYGLIAIHSSAGLYHHYIARDNALRLMLPKFCSRRQAD